MKLLIHLYPIYLIREGHTDYLLPRVHERLVKPCIQVQRARCLASLSLSLSHTHTHNTVWSDFKPLTFYTRLPSFLSTEVLLVSIFTHTCGLTAYPTSHMWDRCQAQWEHLQPLNPWHLTPDLLYCAPPPTRGTCSGPEKLFCGRVDM